MPDTHARLSPSNHRWVYCPGSIREEQQYPDIETPAAKSGTRTHLLLETCLNRKLGKADTYLGTSINSFYSKNDYWIVKQDRIDRVNVALSYVSQRITDLQTQYEDSDITVESETKSNPGKHFNRHDWWGTVDVTIKVTRQNVLQYLEVIDYKDGQGYVDVMNNSQLQAYLFGKLQNITYNSTELKADFRTTIIQPKTITPIRYIDYEFKHIYTKIKELNRAASRTDDSNAPLIPDKENGKGYCRWCKHKHNCTELINSKLKGLEMYNNNNEKNIISVDLDKLKNINKLSDKELSHLLNVKPVLQELIESVELTSLQRLKKGHEIPSYTLKPGSSKKVWTLQEDEIIKKLQACKFKKDDMYTRKFITPAQVLKSDKLTNKQRQRFESEYILIKEGELKVTKVKQQQKNAVDMFSDLMT